MTSQARQTTNNIVPHIAEKFIAIMNVAIVRESVRNLPDSLSHLISCHALNIEVPLSRANKILGKIEDVSDSLIFGERVVRSGKRICFENVIYHSQLWKKGENSSSMYVRLMTVTEGCEFARLERFYETSNARFYAYLTLLARGPEFYRGLSRISLRQMRYLNMSEIGCKIGICNHGDQQYFLPLGI